jgi:prepilin-type N-terminal cleavage/methylation domain-containing protein
MKTGLKNTKGFTLIELLVVVAIISLLSSIVMASLNSARAKARDAKRQSDAHQITLALGLYFSTNGVYPSSGGATAPNGGWSNSSDNSWTTLATQLSPFIPSLAKDPQQSADSNYWGASGSGGAYSYINCGNSYMFVYSLENAKGPDPGIKCGVVFYQYGGSGVNTNIKTVGDYAY